MAGMSANPNASSYEDDVLSYCGSFGGDTITARRGKKGSCRLRQHSVSAVARRLREQSIDLSQENLSTCSGKKRFNTVFHNFRFLVVMMSGISGGIILSLRYNISVAILRMVNQTALYMAEHPNSTMEDFLEAGHTPGGEFVWNHEIQQMIMSWYMMAYTLPQVAASRLGIYIGGRWAVPISLSLCGFSTVTMPIVAYWGWEWVIGLRLINGVGASAILPIMIYMIENWMPYNQLSLGLSMAVFLFSVIMALTPIIVGYLCTFGWKTTFYLQGGLTFVFCILWAIVVTDRPDENRLVSQKELELICGCDKTQNHNHAVVTQKGHSNKNVSQNAKDNNKDADNKDDEDEYGDAKPDWKRVFLQPSFYAYVIMWCMHCTGYSGFAFFLPTYLKQFMKIHITENGFYCSIIQTGCLFACIWPHPLLRFLQTKMNMSLTAARRWSYVVVVLATAGSWITVGLFHQYQLPLLFINRAFQPSNDVIVTASLMSNYAKAGLSSLVFSIVNTFGNLAVVFAATTIGWYLDYTGQSVEGWTYIYLIFGGAQFIMLLLFITFITSEPIDLRKKKKKSEKKLDIENVRGEIKNHDKPDNDAVSSAKSGGTLNNFEKLRAEPRGEDNQKGFAERQT